MSRFVYVLIAGFIAGCSASGDEQPTGDVPHDRPIYVDPATDDDGVLRVLVYHDMEGLAGQEVFYTAASWHTEDYALGRTMLTADVNAVIDGLFAGGADEVHVVDAHGSGSSEPDLLLDQLDPRAEHVFRDEPFRPYVDLTEAGLYDAVAVVGMHAKPLSRGFLSHTFSIGTIFLVNGMSITETELIGYSWGRVDVPVVFASGDDRLESDLATMPWIEFVQVKTAISPMENTARPADEARADLRAGAQRALENRDQAKAMHLATPIRAALRVHPPSKLDMMAGVPGIEYSDQQVSFDAADFGEAYDGVIALMGVASAGHLETQLEVLLGFPEVARFRLQARDSLYQRWLEYEAGRWEPEPAPAAPPGKRYHGVT